MNIPISVEDKRILKFDNLQKEPALDTATATTIAMAHDLELTGPNKWLVHVDTWFTIPGIARALTRISYSLKTKFENVWADGVAIEFIKPALNICRQGINENCKAEGIECEIGEDFPNPEHIASCLAILMQDVQSCRLYSNEDKKMYTPDALTITPGNETNLVFTVTAIVLDEIFMDNPGFNRTKNIETFLAYIPLRNYSTIKIKMLELREGKKAHLNMKQLTIYIFMIRCACTLLLSDHYDTMKESIEEKGVTEELYKRYIQTANTFLNNLKADLAKAGAQITNLEEDIDWAALVC